jgi:hypothetical protein
VALSRFVLTSTVTLTPEAAATVVAGEPATGGAAGFGNYATGAQSAGKYGWLGQTVLKGTVIWADSVAGTDTGAKIIYQAIGSANLRAWTDTDAVGHAALAN